MYYHGFEQHKRNQLRVNNYIGCCPYFVFLRPKKSTPRLDVDAFIKRFKQVNDKSDVNLIQQAAEHFKGAVAHNGLDFGIKSVNDIDLILSVPSSRLANDKILEILHSTIPNAAAFRHAFAKGLTENVKVDHDRILSESSKKTPAYVENEVRCMKEKHKGQRFEVKFLEMSFRRYVYNFMTVILENAANLIRGKNVLLVDDTIGEGITLKETSRLVNQFQPKSIIGFAITRDMYRT